MNRTPRDGTSSPTRRVEGSAGPSSPTPTGLRSASAPTARPTPARDRHAVPARRGIARRPAGPDVISSPTPRWCVGPGQPGPRGGRHRPAAGEAERSGHPSRGVEAGARNDRCHAVPGCVLALRRANAGRSPTATEAIRLDPADGGRPTPTAAPRCESRTSGQGLADCDDGHPARPGRSGKAYACRGRRGHSTRARSTGAIADLDKADPPDARQATGIQQPRLGPGRVRRVRRGPRRLQRGDPARSPPGDAANRGCDLAAEATSCDKAIADVTRRSGSIPTSPRLRQPRRRLAGEGGARRGHRRPRPRRSASTPTNARGLRRPRRPPGGEERARQGPRRPGRGDPARAPRPASGPHQSRRPVGCGRTSPDRASPTWTRRSGSTRETPRPTKSRPRLDQEERVDEAIADLNEAIRLDPGRPGLQQPRLRLDERKQPDRGIRAINEAIRLDPRMSGRSVIAAEAWIDREDYDKAIADFDAASGSTRDT